MKYPRRQKESEGQKVFTSFINGKYHPLYRVADKQLLVILMVSYGKKD